MPTLFNFPNIIRLIVLVFMFGISSISLNAQSDLYLINTVNNPTPELGETVFFTISVVNEGPDDATNILVHEQLPAGMTFLNAGTPSQGSYLNNVWTLGNLANGASATLTISATIDVRGMQSNIVEIISVNQADPDSTPNNGIVTEDDMDLACVTIPYFLCEGDSYTLTAPEGHYDYIWMKDDIIVQGPGVTNTYIVTEPGSYHFEATHINTCSVENECPVEFLPGTPTFSTVNFDPTFCEATDGKIIVNATGGSGIFHYSKDNGNTWQSSNEFIGLPADTYQIIVRNSDESCESLIEEITLTDPLCADLVTVKTLQSSDNTPNEGDAVIFKITVTNNGVNTAPNVVLTDLLPAGITYVSHASAFGNYNFLNGKWSGFNLTALSSASLFLNGTIDAGTSGTIITNITTKATSGIFDPSDDGNDLEESVYVNIRPVATNNISSSNVAGFVAQEIILENDGDGSDYDLDGTLATNSVDLDPSTPHIIDKSLDVPGEGTWIETGDGNVSFFPESNFTNDPTVISYTIQDNDGLKSNVATITVDYVPVSSDDESLNNITNTAVTVNVTDNDTNGDFVDPTTVQIIGTLNPGDPLVVAGEGTWTVNPVTGAITFTPQAFFTADPTDIYYEVSDHEGNISDPALVNIEYLGQPPVATDNESLANNAGVVTQEVINEDDGYGSDNDPDGTLVLSSIDLDPGSINTNEKTLIVIGEGIWTEDGNGLVTFNPEPGFTNDPTPIYYTIEDNDDNESNVASIMVDYVPVGMDDESLTNITNNPAVVNVLLNDTAGDLVDPATVQIVGTANVGDPLIVPNEGFWTINPVSGVITFTPLAGFTSNPTDIQYTVDDHENNTSDPINVNVEYIAQPPVATNNESLANLPGPVVQEVILDNDGFGVDQDPDGALTMTSVDLDPSTPGVNDKSLIVPGEGTWSEDGNGNVSFAPEAGFTYDPTPISYTIEDNDGNESNVASILVDYVPVASDDESLGNSTGSSVTVDVIVNDITGDLVDPFTVQIVGTSNAGDPLTVPGEGFWMVNTITGAITFTPQAGFTGDPTDITYVIKDDEGNISAPANVNIDYDSLPPIATYNEDLANLPGPVVQEVILDNDGFGVDHDPDGSLVNSSIDLNPATAGINDKILIVPGEGIWTEDGNGNVTFTPELNFTFDPTPIYYNIEDNDGNESNEASIVVDYVPITTNDESLGNTTNTNVTVNVLNNDTSGDLVDPTTVKIIGTANAGDPLIVPNEGIWSVDPVSGAITFSPLPGFTADPTDIEYTVKDHEGNISEDTNVNIEYVAQPPVATANESTGNMPGFVAQEIIVEDDGYGVDNDPDGILSTSTVDLDPSSPETNNKSFAVPGEGNWIELGNGFVIFTPEPGFTHDPTPISYTIEDNDGNESNFALIIVDYVPIASDDESLANAINSVVTIDVLDNDTNGDLADPTTVKITGTANAGDPLTVAGEGTWTIDPVSGAITFTPEAGFITDPTDISYTVEDEEGNVSNTAIVHIEYQCSTVIVKVFLEGPYLDGGSMTTHLNTNHLLPGQDKMLSPNFSVRLAANWTPIGQPYNTAPWNYSGNLGLPFGDPTHPNAPVTSIAYDADVVDWVLVTVREGGKLPADNIWRCAGWLHSNGDVSFPEECECLTVLPGEDYYLMVEHRNHLGVLSHTPVNKINGNESLQWDFTIQNSYTPDVFRKGQIQLETGIWGMFAANGEQINSIQAINSADHTVWKGHQNSINYRYGDFNLNVTTNSEDETIWKNNQNVTSGVIFY